MRISHTELEWALQDPKGWLASKAAPTTGPRLGYDQIVRFGIQKYHKAGEGPEGAAAARSHVEQMFARHSNHFRNETRIEDAQARLDSYIRWHTSSALLVIG